MRTLVLGGCGFIGGHVVQELIGIKREVTVLGRVPTLGAEDASVVTLHGDYGNREFIGKLLDAHQEVVHLAYASAPKTSFDSPMVDLLDNVPRTVQLLEEVARRDIKIVIVSSGGTVYGEARNIPISEEHQTKPISPYGLTKLTIENYANMYAKTSGLKYICVRPSNAYGIGQQPFKGQGFISTAIMTAMKGEAVKIFGPHGTIRDYIYVSDVASGIVAALRDGKLSETYNIGSGVGLNNLEIVNLLNHSILKYDERVEVENLKERLFDVKVNILDSRKLRDQAGWRPKVDILEGLETTYDWLRLMTN